MQGLDISKLIPWKSLIFLVAGLVLLAFLIIGQGADAVGAQIVAAGPVFLAIIGISFFYLFLQTFAWQVSIKGNTGSFWSLFKIKASGDALDALIPFSLIGGAPLQDHLLRDRHQVEAGAESIVVDRSIQAVALAMFAWTGLIVGSLYTTALPVAFRIIVPLVVLAISIFVVIAIRSGKPGFFSPVVSKLGSLGLPGCNSAAVRGQLVESDRLLLDFYRTRRGAFYQILFLQLLCQGLMVVEVYLIGSAIVPDFGPALALLLAAATPVITALFSFIPGAFGIMELLFAAICGLALGGVGTILGIALPLVRRARALVWIIIGMVFTGNPFRMFLK